MNRVRRMLGRLMCNLTGRHAQGVCTYSNDYLMQFTCPRCDAFVLVTLTELVESIAGALRARGYTDVERIA